MFSAPVQETHVTIPEIAPMRRGRPTRPETSQQNSARPSPSPFRGTPTDPFAALDGRKADDEFSDRFPSLDQFNILHEKRGKFEFEPTVADQKEDDALAQKLTNALADDAFVKHSPLPQETPVEPVSRRQQSQPTKTSPVEYKQYRDEPPRQTPLYQPAPQRPAMVSTGTMTSPPESPGFSGLKPPSRPIHRFPSSDQQPKTADNEKRMSRPGISPIPPSKLERDPRISSDRLSNLSASSRPSMEALRPPHPEVDDSIHRSRSANSRSRPLSTHAGTKLELPPRSAESARSSLELPRSPYDGGSPLQHAKTEVEYDRGNISSDVDYLRAKEDESNRKREKRYSGSSSKHPKRSSLSTLSFSGTKTLFGGRFGDAFRRFEGGQEGKAQSPAQEDFPRPLLSPASGSETPVEPVGHPGEADDDDGISPEMRRELERRRLSQEEKRVASAAAEYRRRVAEQGEGGRRPTGDATRAPAIMNRVQTLFGEASKPPPPKTATGYGRFTETPEDALQAKQPEAQSRPSTRGAGNPPPAPKQETTTTGYIAAAQRTGPRPTAPPKPKGLRAEPSGTNNLDRLQGQPTQGTPTSPGEDWEANFSKRYPSLSGLEMVETEIEIPKFPAVRTKEV